MFAQGGVNTLDADVNHGGVYDEMFEIEFDSAQGGTYAFGFELQGGIYRSRFDHGTKKLDDSVTHGGTYDPALDLQGGV